MEIKDLLKEADEIGMKACVIVGVADDDSLFIRSFPDNIMVASFLLNKGSYELQRMATVPGDEKAA